MPPRTVPLRSSPIARKRRTKAETERCHGSPEFRAWIKRQPCVVCGRTPCDAAHLKSGGTGRVDLWAHAARIQALWDSLHSAGFTHVAAIVPVVIADVLEGGEAA